ncbi:MAG: hypothetical protein Q8O89_07645 [Nanoarchaeota archaeon]|nr:hypothetical protein [Nanoarchaeota archaeon]
MEDKLNIPDNALSELKAYSINAQAVSAAAGINVASLTFSAFKGYLSLTEKQKDTFEEIADSLDFTKSYKGISETDAEKILVKTLENITRTENKQGYLNLVQLMITPYAFSKDTVFAGREEQYALVKNLLFASDKFEYNTTTIYNSYERQKALTEKTIRDLKVSEYKMEGMRNKAAERRLKREIKQKHEDIDKLVSGFRKLLKE